MRVLIVGAGIGGLTCGIALRRAGFEVEILERARSLDEVGAGLSLWPNALAALEALGLADAVSEVGCPMPVASFRTPSGRRLQLISPEDARRALGGLPLLLHRAELQAVLLDAAKGIPIRLGTRCERVSTGGPRPVVEVAGASAASADLVVGADGIRSAVRESVAPGPPPRYTGLTGWRAVVEDREVGEAWLTIGPGGQFLATNLTKGRVYLAGVVPLPEGALEALPALGPLMRRTFAGWHEPIAELIDAIAETAYIRDDIFDRPAPTRMCWGRTVLIGDAAHPVTPDLGQGGCQAIEDAVVLARALAADPDLDPALRRFERTRLRRVRPIVTDSHLIGQVLGSTNPLTTSARSIGLRVAPGFLRVRLLAQSAGRAAFFKQLDGLAPA